MPFSLSAGDTLGCSISQTLPTGFISRGASGWEWKGYLCSWESRHLAILVFMFFSGDRDKANLFFSLLCVTLMLHYSIIHNDPWFVRWFIPNRPGWQNMYGSSSPPSVNYSFSNLEGIFVNLPKVAPRIDKYVAGRPG